MCVYIYIYIYIYMCVCVCLFVCARARAQKLRLTEIFPPYYCFIALYFVYFLWKRKYNYRMKLHFKKRFYREETTKGESLITFTFLMLCWSIRFGKRFFQQLFFFFYLMSVCVCVCVCVCMCVCVCSYR